MVTAMFTNFLISILLLANFARSADTDFILNGFRSSNLSLSGISEITNRDGLLQLTNNTKGAYGRAFYPFPLQFKKKSFSTTFVFAIVTEHPDVTGPGMTFALSPTKEPFGSLAGLYYGLFNDSNNGKATNHILAIELDTSRSVGFGDINDNHLGIDINGIRSVNSSAVSYLDDRNVLQSLTLASGDPMQIWVDYISDEMKIEVRISPIGVSRPKIPLVSSKLDLSSIILDETFVGFSASLGEGVEFHYVLGWSFSLGGVARSLDLKHLPSIPRLKKDTRNRLQATAVALPLVGVIILLISIYVIFLIIKRRKKFAEVLEDWELEYGPHRFSYKDLFWATKGFKEERLLGVGGFGRVYRGILSKSNLEIAVKKISHESQQGMKEFVAEIVSMGRLRHRNLVQLLGYCRRQGELLLVYEFMPNGSLDKFLFGEKNRMLSWKQRLRIIKGVASGLSYLHDGWEQVVIHRDIKAANVLLDYELNGKLGDFGLARLYDHGSNPHTTHIVGTLGYLAPEISTTGKATTETDVYAYGAFLLEVACGKRPFEVRGLDTNLVDQVMDCWKRGVILEARDANLGNDYAEKEMELVLKLGLFCSHPDPSMRPSMKQVMQFLGGDATLPEMWLDCMSAPGRGYDVLFGDFTASMEYPSSTDSRLCYYSLSRSQVLMQCMHNVGIEERGWSAYLTGHLFPPLLIVQL